MLSSFASPGWEKLYFDNDTIAQQLAMPGNSNWQVMFDDTNEYFEVFNTDEPPSNDSSVSTPLYRFIPARKEASLWQLCDTIPDKARKALSELETGTIPSKCESLLYYSDEDVHKYHYLDMLMHLSRSGLACAVTALICVIVGTCLGLFAAARQQIVFAMIAGVCFFASSLYTSFAVVLILTRKNDMEKEERFVPDLFLPALSVSNGWSMYLGWVVFVFTALTGGAWIALSIELKKSRASYNYNVKYKQICGT